MNAWKNCNHWKRWGTRLGRAWIVLCVIPLTWQIPSGCEAARRALLVAVRDYPDCQVLKPLPGTGRDAERLRRTLLRGGFEAQDIQLIYDDAPSPDHRPTRHNILRRVELMLSQTGQRDLLLIVLTGHGVVFDGHSYLCPSDTTNDGVQSAAAARRQLVPVADIIDRMSTCKARNKLLVVDACRDATRSRTRGFVRLLRTPPDGVWLMSSCSEEQYSFVSRHLRDGEPHAVFSYFLCEGLGGAADQLGDNNQKTSLFELYSYAYAKTQDAVSQLGEQQTPELFGGVAEPFDVAVMQGLFPARNLRSSDPAIVRHQTSMWLSDTGNRMIRRAHAGFLASYRQWLNDPRRAEEDRIYTEYRNIVNYALATYLVPAIELDPRCKIARRARGWAYRSCGQYAQAVREFQAGGEHLDLFVKGDYQSLQQFLSYASPNGGPGMLAVGDGRRAKTPTRLVALHRDPTAASPSVGHVFAHSRIRIDKVDKHSGAADPKREWLRVTAVDDNPLPTPGWIARDEVHWFAEAADFYTPASPMLFETGRAGVPLALSRLDAASQGLHSIADRLGEPARRIGELRNAISNSGPAIAYRRVQNVLGIFGVSAPSGLDYVDIPLRTAQAYTELPSRYLRTAAGYVSLPSDYGRIAAGWAGVVEDYGYGMRRAERVAQQEQHVVARDLAPLGDRQITIRQSPWRVESELTTSSKQEGKMVTVAK